MLKCSTHSVQEPAEILDNQIELEAPLDFHFCQGGYSDIKCAKLWMRDPREQDPSLVVIKCFRPRPGPPEISIDELNALIQEELLVWKILNHCPHILRLYGIISGPNLGEYTSHYIPPYPVSEYHDYGSLKSYLRRQSHNITDLERLRLLVDIIRGIEYIHSKLIVHGDLKADNVIVSKTPEGCITKICDFGSSHSNCNACYKGSKNKAGTFQWSSPEVLEEEPATAKSDVWTFGCVALEVLFAKNPYHDDLRIAMSLMDNGRLPALEEDIGCNLEVDTVKKLVWDVMQKCWQWEPDQRSDAQEILIDLDSALKSHETAHVPIDSQK